MTHPPAYDAAGPSDASPIVLLHGTRLTRASWRPQLDRLSGEFRIIAPDLPGHGKLAGQRFTLEGAARRAAEVIDEAAGGRATVVGLSLGGYVAIELATRFPERVAGLVLAGTSQEPVGVRTVPYRLLAFALARGRPSVLERVNRWFFRTRFPADVSEPLIAGGFWSAGGAVALGAILGVRFAPRLARYPGPTLLLNGELDVLFRLGERRFLTACRDGRRRVIHGASHLSNLDRPDEFSDAIRWFVRGPVGQRGGVAWAGSPRPARGATAVPEYTGRAHPPQP